VKIPLPFTYIPVPTDLIIVLEMFALPLPVMSIPLLLAPLMVIPSIVTVPIPVDAYKPAAPFALLMSVSVTVIGTAPDAEQYTPQEVKALSIRTKLPLVIESAYTPCAPPMPVTALISENFLIPLPVL